MLTKIRPSFEPLPQKKQNNNEARGRLSDPHSELRVSGVAEVLRWRDYEQFDEDKYSIGFTSNETVRVRGNGQKTTTASSLK